MNKFDSIPPHVNTKSIVHYVAFHVLDMQPGERAQKARDWLEKDANWGGQGVDNTTTLKAVYEGVELAEFMEACFDKLTKRSIVQAFIQAHLDEVREIMKTKAPDIYRKLVGEVMKASPAFAEYAKNKIEKAGK